jgi:hypothetical protein
MLPKIKIISFLFLISIYSNAALANKYFCQCKAKPTTICTKTK